MKYVSSVIGLAVIGSVLHGLGVREHTVLFTRTPHRAQGVCQPVNVIAAFDKVAVTAVMKLHFPLNALAMECNNNTCKACLLWLRFDASQRRHLFR